MDYEILVNVDNEKLETSTRDSFNKASKECILTYEANGGTGAMDNGSVKSGFSIKLSTCDFERTNFAFVGWCLDSEGTGEKYAEGDSIKITEDTKIYAIWRQEVYTMTFMPNTNGIGESYTQNMEKGTSAKLMPNAFTCSDTYYFAGWNTKEDGTGTSYSDQQNINPTDNLTLYAQWKTYYTVTYNGNNGTSEKQQVQVKQGATSKTLGINNFTKVSNKVFKGWNTKSDKTGTAYNPETNYTINSNLDLYAIWETATNLYSQITASNYGNKVNYSIEGCNNWEILYKDSSNNVFMIMENCLEYDKFPSGTGISKYSDIYSNSRTINWGTAYTGANTYSGASAINSTTATKFMINYVIQYPSSTRRNVKAIASLADTSKWSKFVSQPLQNQGAVAVGSPSSEMIIASVKQKFPNNANITGISITYTERGASFNNRYYYSVGLSYYAAVYDHNEIYYTLTPMDYGTSSYSDSILSKVTGSSIGVTTAGWGGTENWQNIFGNYYGGIRPVICIPSTVKAGFDGVKWQLDL